MPIHRDDFSAAPSDGGPPPGWRAEGRRKGARLELRRAPGAGPDGRPALRVSMEGGRDGRARRPFRLVWSDVGAVGGDFDVAFRLRWLARASSWSWAIEARPAGSSGDPGRALSAGFGAVRPALGWTRRLRRRLGAIRRGRWRPPALPPPQAKVRFAQEGGGSVERRFGTPGAGFGQTAPADEEWVWVRLTRKDDVVAFRFWRVGAVPPARPWIETRSVETRGAGSEIALVLAHGPQELELAEALLATGGDPLPLPVPDGTERGARGEPAAWLDPDWPRRKRLVVPKSHLARSAGSETLENFPLFVDLSGDRDIRDRARVDGADLMFTAADGVTPLAHECATHRRLVREQAVWTVWTDPRGLRHVGERDRTYLTWYTTNRGWWIGAFDHRSGEWEHVQLRTHAASADGRWWDDHNNPAVTVRPDGRLVVAYNEHSTARGWIRISERPEDISAWGAEIPMRSEQEAGEPDPRYSYADLYALPDGTLWRHYRPRDGYGISRPSTFVTSRDGGESWSAPTRLFEVPTRTPYVVTAQRGDRIDFFCNEAHPNEYHEASIYHFYYDHGSGTYHRSDGTAIGGSEALPIGVGQATLVYDGTTPAGEGWVHSIESDGRGGLAAVYVAYAGEKHGLPDSALVHEVWYARWSGREWERHFLARDHGRLDAHHNQRYYAGGAVVDPEDLGVVYLSLVDPSEGGSRNRRLFRYETPDEGRSWTRRRLTRGEGRAALRPFVPRNRHEELPVFWLHGDYVNYYEYNTALAAADDRGPILESEHYVRVPRIDPGDDLVLYVYYGNPAGQGGEDPGAVWPPELRFRHRGSLGTQELGVIELGPSGEATLEAHASLATLRQVDPDRPQPLVSNLHDGGGLVLRRAPGSRHPELLVADADGRRTFAFSDLVLEVRDHTDAADPARSAFVTLRLSRGAPPRCALNGVESMVPASFGPLRAIPRGGPLWACATPDDLTGVPWTGWIRSLRIWDAVLSDAWTALAQRAELDPDFVWRGGEERAPAGRPRTTAARGAS